MAPSPAAGHPPGRWDLRGLGEGAAAARQDQAGRGRAAAGGQLRLPPGASFLPRLARCFPKKDPELRVGAHRAVSSPQASGASWATAGHRPVGASRLGADGGQLPGTDGDRPAPGSVCRRDASSPGRGSSSRPAVGSAEPCVAELALLCVRCAPRGGRSFELGGLSSGLGAVTLAGRLSRCVLVFFFKPFWRFISSQERPNQMSHGRY